MADTPSGAMGLSKYVLYIVLYVKQHMDDIFI